MQQVLVYDSKEAISRAEDQFKHTSVCPHIIRTGQHLLRSIEKGYEVMLVTKEKFTAATNSRDAEKRMKHLSQNLIIMFDEANGIS